jgi:hypothetical protein
VFHQQRTQRLKKTVAQLDAPQPQKIVVQPNVTFAHPADAPIAKKAPMTTGMTATVMHRVRDLAHKKQRRARERERLATIKLQHRQSWEQEEPGLATPVLWSEEVNHDNDRPSSWSRWWGEA